MYEFRGTTLQEAVHNALGHPILSTKKLAKASAKFDFATRMHLGGVLFVGEGNLSFALTMARKSRAPASSILATVYEAENDLTDTGYPGYTHQNTVNEESTADGHTAFATFSFSG